MTVIRTSGGHTDLFFGPQVGWYRDCLVVPSDLPEGLFVLGKTNVFIKEKDSA